MNKSTVVFFFSLLLIVLLIAHYNSRSNVEQTAQSTPPHSNLVPAATPSPSIEPPKATPSQTPQLSKEVDFAKIVTKVHPSVVLISVFESSGKLLKTGTGFFVSDQGQIITSRSVMEGGAHAVAKTSDGRIENISGIIEDAASVDLVILKTEAKDRVPFVSANPTANADEGARIAVVASPLTKIKPAYFERAISKRRSDSGGDWLELSMAVPDQSVGSPVMNEHGDVIGVITRGPGNPPSVVVRSSGALSGLLAQVDAEAKTKWLASGQGDESPSPSESPRKSKLIYSPAPQYPSAARTGNVYVKASGRYRVAFGANGEVKNVTVTQSTQNGALDQAAVDALRRWKAAPGQEWTMSVPITFRPSSQ